MDRQIFLKNIGESRLVTSRSFRAHLFREGETQATLLAPAHPAPLVGI